MQQAINSTDDGLVYQGIYTSLHLNELSELVSRVVCDILSSSTL